MADTEVKVDEATRWKTWRAGGVELVGSGQYGSVSKIKSSGEKTEDGKTKNVRRCISTGRYTYADAQGLLLSAVCCIV